MTVVDSSGWIEYFTGGPLADRFAPAIEKTGQLLIPTLILFEVYRFIKRNRNEEEAIRYTSIMSQGEVIPLDDAMALYAADLSIEHGLAMADSIIYATAMFHQAKLVTCDSDFRNLPNVTCFSKS
jgi:toxin FitB